MYKREKTLREDRYDHERKNPSFSSTLLDEIYRSIDDGDKRSGELRFYRETTGKKQSRGSGKSNRALEREEEEAASLRRASLIEKWMDKKVSEKAFAQRRLYSAELERKSHLDHDDHDRDVLFFSSTSSSSDSSSGGFSSSDTDSMYCVGSRSSCFAPPRPKPVRTSVSARNEKSEKTERKQSSTLFSEQREFHMIDDYHRNSTTGQAQKHEEVIIKSKSRALKIYANLKKVKQPISPGGRLANFLNSIFSTANSPKKTKSLSSIGGYDDACVERKSKSVQESTCSSASSFSRSCLSKTSPSSREKLRNGVKRTVRFYPVSVIVDEDCRPCGHKSLYEEENSSLMPVSVPTSRKIGRSPPRKKEEELSFKVIEKSRRVEAAAREFLKDYHQNQKKNELFLREIHGKHGENEYEEDDDAMSCSSSDLFELDHLSVMGNNNRYLEELPVYETTHVDTNRAIANGLIM